MANATWLAEELRAAGLKVSEVDGWKTRGHATMGDVAGVICHHTAGKQGSNMPSLGIVTKGRPDLAGPLCNLALGRDGTWYVVAAGLAYHAGKGVWQGVTAGNSRMIGVEAENDGVGEVWPEVQLDAYARGVAVVLAHVGAKPIMCCGHKEFALPKGRKIDPTFDMAAFRLRVAAVMNGGVVRAPIPAVDAAKRPTLRRGDRGEAVKLVQRAVLGNAAADGVFGAATEAALRAYQRTHGLVPDGIAGPAFWATL